jgi:hypothetical protein
MATGLVAKRFPLDHTMTPLVENRLISWPSVDVALGDMLFGMFQYVTTGFDGTTPKITSYIGAYPANLLDRVDVSTAGGGWDTYPGTGMAVAQDILGGFGGSTPASLVTGAGFFSVMLDDGAGSNPHCTVGATEIWLLFIKNPSVMGLAPMFEGAVGDLDLEGDPGKQGGIG